jgi:hypothetical protein
MKMTVFLDVAPCSHILTEFSEKLTASAIVVLMMETASSSRKSVTKCPTTRSSIPEEASRLQLCKRPEDPWCVQQTYRPAVAREVLK